MSSIQETIESIRNDFANNKFDKFIHDINFPKFKNFVQGTKIQFKFPITILVGPNGGGKTSVLHALYGTPHGHTTAKYWIATSLDKIDKVGGNHRYWYTYYNATLKEKIQARKINDPNKNNRFAAYWEPAKLVIGEGMTAMPNKNAKNQSFMSDSADRWKPVDRKAYLINPKSESSSVERYFYNFHNSMEGTYSTRLEELGRKSAFLKRIVDEHKTDWDWYGKTRVKENALLSPKQLSEVNKILGKKYTTARFVRHSIYDQAFSVSVLFETSSRKYTEHFAGSGELAVVNLVLSLERLEKYDLLLLDEPETSLHPGAQKRLIAHILNTIKDKKLQVVISTHSLTFVNLLPVESLVVLEESESGVSVKENPSKLEAFHRLGDIEFSAQKTTILVEDLLLLKMVEAAVRLLPKEKRAVIEVKNAGVGASEMWSNQVKAFIQLETNILLIVDGDQQDVLNAVQVNDEDLSENKINAIIEFVESKNISIVGTGRYNKIEESKKWIGWCRDRVLAIEELCPEKVFLSILEPESSVLNESTTNTQYKTALKKYFHTLGLNFESKELAANFALYLATLEKTHPVSESLLRLSEKIANLIE